MRLALGVECPRRAIISRVDAPVAAGQLAHVVEVKVRGADPVSRLAGLLRPVLGPEGRCPVAGEHERARRGSRVGGQVLVEDAGQPVGDCDGPASGGRLGGSDHPALSDEGLGLLLDRDGPVHQLDVPAFERRWSTGVKARSELHDARSAIGAWR